MNFQTASFIGLLTLVTLAFFGLVADFLQPIFWAAILAVIFYPVNQRMRQLLGRRKSTAALLSLLIICVTVIIPFWFVASAVVGEAANFYTRIQAGELNPAGWLEWLQGKLPLLNDLLDRMGMTTADIREKVSSAAVAASRYIGSMAVSACQSAVRFGLMFFVMLYVLYFFLRDGAQLLEIIIHALPIGDACERELFAKFAEVSRATIKGTIVIGILQGTLGGLIFWLLGLEAAVFWGAVMVVLSIVPMLGAGLIWVPAAVIMVASGDYIKAAVLVVFGLLVIGLVDNLLRPVLVGRDARMPDYLILLSTLGGLTMFGVSGFVIGPIIAALFLTLWGMFAKEFSEADLGAPAD